MEHFNVAQYNGAILHLRDPQLANNTPFWLASPTEETLPAEIPFYLLQNPLVFGHAAFLQSQFKDSKLVVPCVNDETDEADISLRNNRDFKSYFQTDLESRMDYLLRIPMLLYDNLNAGDFHAINSILSNTFHSNAEIETFGPKSIKVGRQYVFHHFLKTFESAPDLVVTTEKPTFLHDRVIAVNIHIRGTKIDYNNHYLDDYLKYYMSQTSSSSPKKDTLDSRSSPVKRCDNNKTVKKALVFVPEKRTYGVFIKEKRNICFSIHFTIHFVLNHNLANIVKFIEIIKSVKLSVPRKSFM